LQRQAERRALIEQELLPDGGPLALLGSRLGEKREWVAEMRAHALSAADPLTPEVFLSHPAAEPWRYLWLGRLDNGYAGVVALRGLKVASLPALRQAAAGLDGVQWVDKVGEISSVLGRYRKYMGWVLLFSFLAVYGLLYPRYRRSAWRVLAPTALGSLATLSLLGLTGQNLQLFHVLALMLVLGIGVDYGIFLHEPPAPGDDTAWLAIGLSACSTLLSFGLLGLSRTPALQAFSLAMSVGVAVVWLVSPCFGHARVSARDS
jgi:predicted exporter